MRRNIALLSVMGLCVGLAGIARSNEQVGAAASDPGAIAGIVGAMGAGDVAPFAGQVMDAIAKMPLAPKRRVRQMAVAAEAFLNASPEGQQAVLIGWELGNVPPRLLPGLVDAFKPAVSALTSSLDAAAHAAFTAKVLTTIDGLSLDDESKTIAATFALVLLARSQTPEETEKYLAAAVAVLPESYRDEVAAAAPSALNGDYTMLLGPEAETFRLVSPDAKVTNAVVQVGVMTTRETAPRTDDETIFIDVGLERPSVLPIGEGGTSPSPSSPVVPPPYKGQF
ncbi:MAG: hypothetical protein PHR35_09185 [Kiritimatiellae bacterium]|nr:hypothetical protein [Kiritimatiellia bacterium]